jgi:putative membrane protein
LDQRRKRRRIAPDRIGENRRYSMLAVAMPWIATLPGGDTALTAIVPLAWNGEGHPDSEWWWIGRLVMFLLWFALIALVLVLIFRRGCAGGWRGGGNWPGPNGVERARDILAERYARGEITTDEYVERLESIERVNAGTRG